MAALAALQSTLTALRASGGRRLNAALDADVDALSFDLRVTREVAVAAMLASSGDVDVARAALDALTEEEMASLDVVDTASQHAAAGAAGGSLRSVEDSSTSVCTRRECRRRKERVAALEQAVLTETLRCDRRVFEVENATSSALRRLEAMLRAAEELAAKRGAECERVVARANALHVESSARGSTFDDELIALRKSLTAATRAQSSLSNELGAKEVRIASLEERVVALSATRAAESQRVVAEQASRVRELEREVERSGVRAQLERERALSAASLKVLALQARLRETEARVVEAERRIELWEGTGPVTGDDAKSGGASSTGGGIDVRRLAGEASGGAVWT